MKNKSLKIIYDLILNYGPISKVDIIEKTKMSRNKVDRTIEKLLEDHLILERGLGESIGGRPPSLYQINQTHSYIIGINISRSYTHITLFNLSLNPLDSASFAMTKTHTPEVTTEKIINQIKHFLGKYNLSINKILGIGIGSVAPLDPGKGILLNPERFLAPGWENVPIVDVLKREFPVPIILETSANTSVYGAYKSSAFRYDNLIYFISGWFIGAGVITEGKLVFSKKNGGHDYNHIIIEPDGKECICGKKGCLFAYTSLFSLIDEIQKITPRLNSEIEITSVPEILHFIDQEYRLVREILMTSANHLGVGLANITTTLHSEHIILSGPLINHYPEYYETVCKSLKRNNLNSNIYITNVDNEGIFEVTGAAALLFNSLYLL